jgi:predicted AlkP superfamily phosphohydrolase/phosphomutase
VKRILPIPVQDRLTLLWRTGGIDWNTTKAFAAFCDLDGYIRINLRGREPSGIVEPGAEYDELCEQIVEGLRTFVDGDTGEPVVDAVARLDELYPEGRMCHHLPDLMIRWSPRPAAKHRVIRSTRYGTIPWPTPGHHPQGRSGNHRPDGFFVARGDRIQPETPIEDAHILDLVPTAYSLLDLPVPGHLPGRPLF